MQTCEQARFCEYVRLNVHGYPGVQREVKIQGLEWLRRCFHGGMNVGGHGQVCICARPCVEKTVGGMHISVF